MYNNLIKYIRRKLKEKCEILDYFDIPNDKQIKYILLTTIEIVNEECQQYFYCKRFSFGLLCKIKQDIQDNCFHFTLDVNKVLKKKYYHILITIGDCTMGEHMIDDKNLSQKTHKNIIYEIIRISEILKDFREINNISSISKCADVEEQLVKL